MLRNRSPGAPGKEIKFIIQSFHSLNAAFHKTLDEFFNVEEQPTTHLIVNSVCYVTKIGPISHELAFEI